MESFLFVVAGKFNYDRKKKVPVACLAGCAVVSVFVLVITTGKKSSSHLSGGLCCCVNFWFWQLRPEKKVPVICLAGCAVVSVFASGGKLAFFCCGGKV